VTVLATLPAEWPSQRDTLHRLAAHVLAPARRQIDGMFDLVPAPGGFGTPHVGTDRRRLRISGGHLVVETVAGARLRDATATTTATRIAGSSIRALATFVGVQVDPIVDLGPDTPPLGDPDAALDLADGAAVLLGDWLAVGARAIDDVIARTPDAAASVARLWPEHFDLGTDLNVGGGRRCNLGASAGDASHAAPYFYVGPWGDERPGDAAYWNAAFGAVLGYDDVRVSDRPVQTVVEFVDEGLRRLAGVLPA